MRRIRGFCGGPRRDRHPHRHDDAEAATAAAPVPLSDPQDALVSWNVPPEFPCGLIRLPARVLNCLENHGIAGLCQLLDEWKSAGFKGFSALPNIGIKSARLLEVFVDSLRKKDHETASTFLPLDASRSGLALGRALALVAADHGPTVRSLLRRRLVERMSLDASSEEYGVTGERVRQMEVKFLNEVRAVLEYFDENCARLVEARTRGGNWLVHLQLQDLSDDEELIAGALETVFGESPEAVARGQREQDSIETWFDELVAHPDLWFGGVPLAAFLKARVPVELRQRFCEQVFASSVLRIDFVEGLVQPAKTSLRHTVAAMLAGRTEPMPLSRLMELLHRSGYHPALSPRALQRQRHAWFREFGLSLDLILWEE